MLAKYNPDGVQPTREVRVRVARERRVAGAQEGRAHAPKSDSARLQAATTSAVAVSTSARGREANTPGVRSVSTTCEATTSGARGGSW